MPGEVQGDAPFDPHAAVRDHVDRGNRVITWVMVCVYGLLTVSHVLVLPPWQARLLAPLSAGTVLTMLAVGIWARSRPEAALRHAHGISLISIFGIFLNSQVHLMVSGDARQTTNHGIVLFAASTVLLAAPGYYAMVALTWIAWVLTFALRFPHESATHWVFFLVSSTVVATVINYTRRASVVRLERLRAEDRARRRTLEGVTGSLHQLLDRIGDAIVAFERDGRITGAVSQRATLILGAREGASITALLFPERSLTPVEISAFEQFLELAFSISPEDFGELAELAPRMVRTVGPDGVERQLGLDFRPIVEEGRLARVLLLARDETEYARLGRELREQEESHERRIQHMRRMLGVGPLLSTFLRGARRRMERIETLERDEVLQHAHALKGEADALELEDVRAAAAALESAAAREVAIDPRPLARALDDARDAFVRAAPSGEAALEQIAVRGDDLARLRALGRDDPELSAIVRRLGARPLGELVNPLVERVPAWAESVGKRGRLLIDDPGEPIPTELAEVLPGVLAHLVRNAIAHGIERERGDKPPIGTIHVSARSNHGRLLVEVADDGGGFDLAKLGARDVDEARERAFTPGVSAGATPNGLSGRGVGLPSVRSELAQIACDLEVESSPDGTVFRIVQRV